MKKGFTLVEMLIAVTITSIILAITVSQFLMQKRHVDMQQQQIKLDRDTRLTLSFIVDELREIGLDPKKTHSFGITNGAVNSLIYSSDRNMDGIVDPADAGDIHLNVDTLVFSGNNILPNVEAGGLTFTYYDEAGTIIIALPINEDNGFGFFTPVVAMVEVTFSTKIVDGQGRVVAHSNQTTQCERKNR